MKKLLLLSAALLAATAFDAAADVQARITQKNGSQITGMTRWQPAKKQYLVAVKQGNIETQMEISPADVAKVEVQTPQNLKQAIQTKNTAQLEAIMKQYVMLQYDVVAGNYLARIYLGQNKPADALRACQAVIASNPDAGVTSDLAPVYWKSLLATGQGASLGPTLDEAVRTAPPSIAAGALNVRGDLLRAENKLKEALVDGYLRVIVFHRQQRDAMSEALYKAMEVFETLGQSQHAEKMRTELLTRYSDSDEAKKLRGK